MESNVIIKFDKVSIFQNENLILANVSLEIDKGEFVYLIGKTGSGKSSLLKTLYADLEVRNGIATVAGFDLRTLRTKEIPFSEKTGYCFPGFSVADGQDCCGESLLCNAGHRMEKQETNAASHARSIG